ncbi:MAG: hypothetical protein V4526_03130 [Patescibacteria group bacterium]
MIFIFYRGLLAALISLCALALGFSFAPEVWGAVIITEDISGSHEWTQENSPYVIKGNIVINQGSHVVVHPGVHIEFAESDPVGSEIMMLEVRGRLDLRGSSGSPIVLTSQEGGKVTHWSVKYYASSLGSVIQNAIFENSSSGVSLDKSEIVTSGVSMINVRSPFRLKDSKLVLASSTIKNSRLGIYAERSSLRVTSSLFEKNQKVIVNTLSPQLVMKNQSWLNNTGGEGNAYKNIAASSTISASAFIDNEHGIMNLTSGLIDARGNWWEGDAQSMDDNTEGNVLVEPKLSFNPFTHADNVATSSCCSNIAFIPGLQASRLLERKGGLSDGSSNELWIPNRNLDVLKLKLDESGKGVADVFVGDVIRKAGLKNIYQKLFDLFDDMKGRQVIGDWKALPYDWRLGIDDIVTNGVRQKDSIYKMESEIVALASSSPTGKVSLVAHSNGGLIVKYLVKQLMEHDRGDLIDSVTMIASPEFGTPYAIASLLHGYGQDILGGLVVKQATAMELARTIPASYALLPSERYFEKHNFRNWLPIDIFKENATSSISTHSKFIDFLSNAMGAGIKNQRLFDLAKNIHDVIDSFVFPEGIVVRKLIGIGMPTVSKMLYKGMDVSKTDVYFSGHGDGTVLAHGSDTDDTRSEISFLDLTLPFKKGDSLRRHADITEHPSVLKYIERVGEGVSPSSIPLLHSQEDNIKIPTYVSVSVHSPVALKVCASDGICTGRDQEDYSYQDDVLGSYTENIPGSSYFEIGEDKYITFPQDDGEYSITASGIGSGPVKLSIKQITEQREGSIAEFEFNVSTSSIIEGSVNVLESDSLIEASPLSVDYDGDRIIDGYIESGIIQPKPDSQETEVEVKKNTSRKGGGAYTFVDDANSTESFESSEASPLLLIILDELKQAVTYFLADNKTMLLYKLDSIQKLLFQYSANGAPGSP